MGLLVLLVEHVSEDGNGACFEGMLRLMLLVAVSLEEIRISQQGFAFEGFDLVKLEHDSFRRHDGGVDAREVVEHGCFQAFPDTGRCIDTRQGADQNVQASVYETVHSNTVAPASPCETDTHNTVQHDLVSK